MRSRREQLCRCGSGKRHRQCCGAVIPVVPVAAAGPHVAPGVRDATEGPTAATDVADPARSCGSCSRCCEGTLDGTIRGHVMGGGVACHFLVGGACSIYDERPVRPCRTFYCAWRLRRNPFPEAFRPDRLGVIILSMPWRDRIAYYLVPAGREPDEALLEWMRRHSSATGTPFLFKSGTRHRAYGSPEFQQDLVERASRGEPLLPGLAAGLAGPVALVPLPDDRAAAGRGGE